MTGVAARPFSQHIIAPSDRGHRNRYAKNFMRGFFDRIAIAEHIGTLDIRVGHRLDYRRTQSRHEEWLSVCWDMTFMPTFNEHGTIAVLTTSRMDDNDTPTPSRIVAMLFCKTWAYSKPINDDPVPALLNSIPMIHIPDFRQSRDGRGCSMRFTTTALDMTLQFDNPEFIELREIESACLRIANDLSTASGNPKLIECVQHWIRYANHTA